MFIEFTLIAILEAETGGGGSILFAKVLGASGSGFCWISACGACTESGSFERARLRYMIRLSRIPNRDLSRASTLSRFDTAEPVGVVDWGGTFGG